ncbi:MAG: glycogen/starch synthase [Rikenellaceae bacterium]
MSSRQILYVCQEVSPYLPETQMSLTCRKLAQSIQESGDEIRVFMPRFGLINERRNQLHEVIRLSGMNLIIDNNDHQLIIKVASIPSARLQVYFIDNDDYFQRKAILTDEDGKSFEDNDERALFYARGVFETVKKLRWKPDIIHCQGWFSSMMPVYLRNMFADDPLFAEAKCVVSVYDDAFEGSLNANFKENLIGEGIEVKNDELISEATYQNYMRFVINHTDGVIMETENPDPQIVEHIKATSKPCLEYQSKETTEYIDTYKDFYDKLFM